MKRKRLTSFDQALKYVNRLGVVSRSKPIGWRQSNLCEIVAQLEKCSIKTKENEPCPYPMEVVFNRALSMHRLDFWINGEIFRFDYPK